MYSPPKTTPRRRIPIVPRRMKLDFSDMDEESLAENRILSTMLATLSGIFPPGEKEFIQSVRLFMAQLHDEALIREVELFSTQEGHHALQHRAVNTIFERLGYSATKVAAMVEDEIDRHTRERSDRERIAVTVVMEHFTATLANFILSHPEHFDALPGSLRELLFWHAIEEIEHKSVAFDVYDRCVGDRNLLRKWTVIQGLLFPYMVAQFQVTMLRELGHRPRLDEYLGAARFLFGRRGLVINALPKYLTLLRPGFHPWNHDDSDLVDTWKQRLSSVVA